MKLDMRHVLFFSSLGDCNKGSKQQKVGMGPTSDRKNPARKRLLLVVTCILCPSRPWTHSNVHLWWCNGFGIRGLCSPSWKDIHPGSRKLQRMEESARLEELESRFRTVPRCTVRWKIVCLCQALKKMESTGILFSEGETETVHRTCFHLPFQGTNPPAKGWECAHCEGEPASGQNFILEIGIW